MVLKCFNSMSVCNRMFPDRIPTNDLAPLPHRMRRWIPLHGITTDVERRFQEHLDGKGARYTRSHKPIRLVASCPVGSRADTLRAELALKRLP